MAKSLLLAAIVAGLISLVIARTIANPAAWRLAAGWLGGLSAGIYFGCGLLGEWPGWPPLEDRDRFLTIVLPAALLVEAVAMLMPSRRWFLWSLRIVLATATAPILLHNSIYLADLAGPGSAEWSRPQAVMIMGLSAALLGIVWTLLALLQSRTSAAAMSPLLVAVALATAITVMLSGYYRGGLLALPIAGAIAGISLASFAFRKQIMENPCLGIGILGTFAVVFIGRFYGSLPTSLAICLFVSPLLAWTAEIPRIRKLPIAARTAVRIAAVLVALVVVVACAQVRFNASVGANSDTRR